MQKIYLEPKFGGYEVTVEDNKYVFRDKQYKSLQGLKRALKKKKSPPSPPPHFLNLFQLLKESSKGIDLRDKWKDIRRIYFKHFGSSVLKNGFDPEDVLQEIYKGLLIRNNGRGRFDAEKSSFSHYVYLVCSCVWSNYREKMFRARREILWDENESPIPSPKTMPEPLKEKEILQHFQGDDLHLEICKKLLKGYSVVEIQKQTGLSKHRVYSKVNLIKNHLRDVYSRKKPSKKSSSEKVEVA